MRIAKPLKDFLTLQIGYQELIRAAVKCKNLEVLMEIKKWMHIDGKPFDYRFALGVAAHYGDQDCIKLIVNWMESDDGCE